MKTDVQMRLESNQEGSYIILLSSYLGVGGAEGEDLMKVRALICPGGRGKCGEHVDLEN
jgi:hypothetical protein